MEPTEGLCLSGLATWSPEASQIALKADLCENKLNPCSGNT